MKYTTIFEKIFCLFDLISQSWIDIVFLGIVLFLVLLLGLKKISGKKCFLFTTLACSCLFGYKIWQYFEPLSKMMDSLIDHLFTSIYFPSTYVYLFILIMFDVVTIVSLFNPKGEKIYKTIHGIFFVMINFVLTIILEMIAKNNIDIFSKESLFSNTSLVTLLEFSMSLFILWLIIMIVVYVVNIITEHVIITKSNIELEKTPANISSAINVPAMEANTDYFVDDQLEKAPQTNLSSNVVAFTPDTTQNHFIPSFDHAIDSYDTMPAYTYRPNYDQKVNNVFSYRTPDYSNSDSDVVNSTQTNYSVNANRSSYNFENNQSNGIEFDLSSFIPRKQDIRPIQSLTQQNQTSEIFEQILKNELPIMKSESTISSLSKDIEEQEKNTYTLNDYRIFNKMLKDIREHNQSNSIQIDKNLEYRLITKYSTETYNMFKKMLKIYSN